MTKTTRQLEELKKDERIRFIEFNVALVTDEEKFRREQERVIRETDEALAAGVTGCCLHQQETSGFRYRKPGR